MHNFDLKFARCYCWLVQQCFRLGSAATTMAAMSFVVSAAEPPLFRFVEPQKMGPAMVARKPSQPVADPAGQLVIEHCLVSADADLEVPAQEAGALAVMNVEENAVVQKGTLLAKVDDRKPLLEKLAAERERDAALAKANDDIETRFAKAALAVEEADLEKLIAAKRSLDKSVSDSELRRVQLSRHKAELQIERSRLEQKIAKYQADVHDAAVRQCDDAVNRRKILAPIDGMVVTLFRQQGEWVNAGEPVLQLVKIDVLRVEGFVSAAEFDPADIADRAVTVEIELAHEKRESFDGQITSVSPLVQAGNKYRVRAEVKNRQQAGHWLMRPGMTAKMEIGSQ